MSASTSLLTMLLVKMGYGFTLMCCNTLTLGSIAPMSIYLISKALSWVLSIRKFVKYIEDFNDIWEITSNLTWENNQLSLCV